MSNQCGNSLLICCLSLLFFSTLQIAHSTNNKSILLVKPEITSQNSSILESNRINENLIEFWTNLTSDKSQNLTVTNDTAPLDNLKSFDLIILPGNICLDEHFIDQIRNYIDSGGSILATRSVGRFDAKGVIRNSGLLKNLVSSNPELTDREAMVPTALQLVAGFPGTCAVVPGFFLRLMVTNSPEFIREPIDDPDINIGGFWSSPIYEESASFEKKQQAGFLMKEFKSGARLAWFGSNLEGLHINEINKEPTQRFFNQLIQWLCGEGVVSIDPWLDGKRSALLVFGEFTSDFSKINDIYKMFNDLGIVTTFGIRTENALKSPDLIDFRESNTNLAILGDNPKTYYRQNLGTQTRRIITSVLQLSSNNDSRLGFRPPENIYDDNTLLAARKAGVKYFLSDNKPMGFYPRFVPMWQNTVEKGFTFFPKCELTLSEIKLLEGGDEKSLIKFILKDAERVFRFHGLYTLNYSDLDLDFNLQEVLNLSIQKLKDDNIWIAPGNEILEWVKQKSKILIQTIYYEKTFEISILNTSSNSLKKARVRIFPPKGITSESMSTKEITSSAVYDIQGNAYVLNLPALQAGDIFKATFEKRRGFLLDLKTKKVLILVFKIILGVVIVFTFAFIWFFGFSKRDAMAGKLSPEGFEIEEDNIEKQPIENKDSEIDIEIELEDSLSMKNDESEPEMNFVENTPIETKNLGPQKSFTLSSSEKIAQMLHSFSILKGAESNKELLLENNEASDSKEFENDELFDLISIDLTKVNLKESLPDQHLLPKKSIEKFNLEHALELIPNVIEAKNSESKTVTSEANFVDFIESDNDSGFQPVQMESTTVTSEDLPKPNEKKTMVNEEKAVKIGNPKSTISMTAHNVPQQTPPENISTVSTVKSTSMSMANPSNFETKNSQKSSKIPAHHEDNKGALQIVEQTPHKKMENLQASEDINSAQLESQNKKNDRSKLQPVNDVSMSQKANSPLHYELRKSPIEKSLTPTRFSKVTAPPPPKLNRILTKKKPPANQNTKESSTVGAHKSQEKADSTIKSTVNGRFKRALPAKFSKNVNNENSFDNETNSQDKPLEWI